MPGTELMLAVASPTKVQSLQGPDTVSVHSFSSTTALSWGVARLFSLYLRVTLDTSSPQTIRSYQLS